MRAEYNAKIKDGKIDFREPYDLKYQLTKLEGKDVIITIEKKGTRRTLRQNSALHLYFQLLAEELNNAGWDMKKTLKQDVDISWTTESVKNYIWRPIQKALLNKKSTTKLTTDEIDKVYDHVNRHIGEKTGVHVDFPSEEQILIANKL